MKNSFIGEVKYRPFRPSDLAALERIHEEAQYNFPFPDMKHMEIGLVVERDGKVAGFAGAQLQAEIVAFFDVAWDSPQQKLNTIMKLHQPIAEHLHEQGIKTTYVSVDPRFARFGKRLEKIGWIRDPWQQFVMPVWRVLAGKVA